MDADAIALSSLQAGGLASNAGGLADIWESAESLAAVVSALLRTIDPTLRPAPPAELPPQQAARFRVASSLASQVRSHLWMGRDDWTDFSSLFRYHRAAGAPLCYILATRVFSPPGCVSTLPTGPRRGADTNAQ